MFTFTEKPAKFNYSTFTERHGEEPKPASSATFQLNLPNEALDMLHPALRPMFYYKAGSDHVADLADAAHDAPNLRAPKLKMPLEWKVRWAGYQIRFHVGTRDTSHVVISDCEIDKIKLDMQEGGTVLVSFTAVFHPDEKTVGKLYSMNGGQFDVSLTAPDGIREVKPKTSEAEPTTTPAEQSAQANLMELAS